MLDTKKTFRLMSEGLPFLFVHAFVIFSGNPIEVSAWQRRFEKFCTGPTQHMLIHEQIDNSPPIHLTSAWNKKCNHFVEMQFLHRIVLNSYGVGEDILYNWIIKSSVMNIRFSRYQETAYQRVKGGHTVFQYGCVPGWIESDAYSFMFKLKGA